MMTNEEEMQLTIGHGHVLYMGGADGTDTLAEEMAREYGMQIEVIVPPNHPRAKFTSPASDEVLMQADPAIGAAAHKLLTSCSQTCSNSLLHYLPLAAQLPHCQKSPYHLCLWKTVCRQKKSGRRNWVDCAISHRSG